MYQNLKMLKLPKLPKLKKQKAVFVKFIWLSLTGFCERENSQKSSKFSKSVKNSPFYNSALCCRAISSFP